MSKILVRATQLGYYGHERRYPLGSGHKGAGEPFYVEDMIDEKTGKVLIPAEKLVSKKWMERVDEKDFAARRKQAEPPEAITEQEPETKPEPSRREKSTGSKEVI